MGDFKAGSTNAVVLAGMCTALAVVLSMIGLYMPLFSTIVFLLIPLPIAYLGMREGIQWSVIVTSGILILDSVFFGIVSAAFLCAIFGILGIVMGICYKHKIAAWKALIAGAVVVLIALVAEGLAALYVLGISSPILGGEGFTQMEQSMNEMLPSFYSGEALTQAQERVDVMMESIRKSIPFAMVAASFFYSWASMTLGKMIFQKMGIKDIPMLPALERWEAKTGSLCVHRCRRCRIFLEAAGHDGLCPLQCGSRLRPDLLAAGACDALVDAAQVSEGPSLPRADRSAVLLRGTFPDDDGLPWNGGYGGQLP